MARLTESDIESAALDWLRATGWQVAYGPDLAPDGPAPERTDYGQVVLEQRLRDALARLNPQLPAEALEDAFRKLTRPADADLMQRNRTLHRRMVDGVTVEYRRVDGSIAGAQARVLDFDATENNDWLAVNQFTVSENRHTRRADIVLFVNGLPLAIIELKNPTDEHATIWAAWQQLQTYKHEIPSLFAYNEALVISDGIEARVGVVGAGREWFKPWRTIAGEALAPDTMPQLQVMIEGLFEKQRFLDLVRDFIVFEDDGSGRLIKKMAGYHQFHAVRVAVAETLRAAQLTHTDRVADALGRYEAGRKSGGQPGDRRIGVVWHTQGSGKSLTMAFYAGRIIREPAMENPTLVVLTDRNDLDDQLFGTFSRCQELLRQPPVQAESRAHLRELLSVTAGGVVFTTIQKFLPEEKGDRHPTLSERRNIVVIADEAHRSQYDFIDGFARHLRDALPGASFIGFTGTPIEQADANTRAVFGDYISIYDIQRAVEDGATVPIYYESRLAKLALAPSEPPDRRGLRGGHRGRGARAQGKAQDEVGAARSGGWCREAPQARRPGHRRALRAAARGDGRQGDDGVHEPAHLRGALPRDRPPAPAVGQRRRRKGADQDCDDRLGLRPPRLAAAHPQQTAPRGAGEALPRPKRSAQTGHRARYVAHRLRRPSLHTLYLDKPMRGHGLMQAIARVNRVFRDKPGGLVVDYLGLAHELKQALATYTESGGTGQTAIVQDEAVALMREKYEICRGLFHEFDWSKWVTRHASGAAGASPCCAGAHPTLAEGQGAVSAGGARAVASLRAGGAARGGPGASGTMWLSFQAVRAALAKRTAEGRTAMSPSSTPSARSSPAPSPPRAWWTSSPRPASRSPTSRSSPRSSWPRCGGCRRRTWPWSSCASCSRARSSPLAQEHRPGSVFCRPA
ncbi:MAG: hypothetical protein KatS3mg052_0941 [Candidatus Roseilinea sp.]|nr:MAG: hypothetical protein KatS3mg052_0941 [Candidatus Roseilinea sp.]